MKGIRLTVHLAANSATCVSSGESVNLNEKVGGEQV